MSCKLDVLYKECVAQKMICKLGVFLKGYLVKGRFVKGRFVGK